MKINIFFVVTLMLTFVSIHAQINDEVFKNARLTLNEQEITWLKHAQQKYNSSFYQEAIIYADSITKEEQAYLNYIKGVFYAHDDASKDKALKLIYLASKEANHIEGYDFNRAFAQSRVDSFTNAIESYKKALEIESHKKHKSTPYMNDIYVRMEQCKNILVMRNKKNEVEIKNIGAPINSDYSEYCPVITSNESIIVFTYRGPKSEGGKQEYKKGVFSEKKLELYYEDIFISKKLNDTLWSEPEAISNLDTRGHDAAVSINSDGTEMFIYKNETKGEGDLFLTKLVGNTWSKPIKQKHLNSKQWEGSACFLPNQNKIIISSERQGGYGGKDLYYVDRIKENEWGNFKNLGPTINSKYDEDAPFVTADGNILFFSTNNESSMGGYDIERSDLVNGFWTKPYNLGPPINTENDDVYFTVRADGKVAYYSSSSKTGKGGQDIYVIKPGIPGKPAALLQVDGLVTLDGKPIAGEIELRSMIKNPSLDYIIKANEISGKFLCNLSSKDEYELTVRINHFPPQVISLNTTAIDTFAVLSIFAEFNSPEFGLTNPMEKLTKSSNLNLPAHKDSVLLKQFGKLALENVKYKVQIGAYRFPQHFNYNNIIGLPKIVMQKDSNNIAHFTLGNYNTYYEAHELLEKIKPHIEDVFIVVYEREKRISLDDYWKKLTR
jgi:WD40-like Beta Propeller Repeat